MNTAFLILQRRRQMKTICVNDREYRSIVRMRRKSLAQAEARHRRKKKTHYNDPKLKAFYTHCYQSPHPVLFTVPFKCSFSIYLYLYLKAQCEPFDFDKGRYQFYISLPVEINFAKIVRVSQLPLNTVRSAYRELVSMGLLMGAKFLRGDKQNECKRAMVVNDCFIFGHDKTTNKIFFNINFNNHV